MGHLNFLHNPRLEGRKPEPLRRTTPIPRFDGPPVGRLNRDLPPGGALEDWMKPEGLDQGDVLSTATVWALGVLSTLPRPWLNRVLRIDVQEGLNGPSVSFPVNDAVRKAFTEAFGWTTLALKKEEETHPGDREANFLSERAQDAWRQAVQALVKGARTYPAGSLDLPSASESGRNRRFPPWLTSFLVSLAVMVALTGCKGKGEEKESLPTQPASQTRLARATFAPSPTPPEPNVNKRSLTPTPSSEHTKFPVDDRVLEQIAASMGVSASNLEILGEKKVGETTLLLCGDKGDPNRSPAMFALVPQPNGLKAYNLILLTQRYLDEEEDESVVVASFDLKTAKPDLTGDSLQIDATMLVFDEGVTTGSVTFEVGGGGMRVISVSIPQPASTPTATPTTFSTPTRTPTPLPTPTPTREVVGSVIRTTYEGQPIILPAIASGKSVHRMGGFLMVEAPNDPTSFLVVGVEVRDSGGETRFIGLQEPLNNVKMAVRLTQEGYPDVMVLGEVFSPNGPGNWNLMRYDPLRNQIVVLENAPLKDPEIGLDAETYPYPEAVIPLPRGGWAIMYLPSIPTSLPLNRPEAYFAPRVAIFDACRKCGKGGKNGKLVSVVPLENDSPLPLDSPIDPREAVPPISYVGVTSDGYMVFTKLLDRENHDYRHGLVGGFLFNLIIVSPEGNKVEVALNRWLPPDAGEILGELRVLNGRAALSREGLSPGQWGRIYYLLRKLYSGVDINQPGRFPLFLGPFNQEISFEFRNGEFQVKGPAFPGELAFLKMNLTLDPKTIQNRLNAYYVSEGLPPISFEDAQALAEVLQAALNSNVIKVIDPVTGGVIRTVRIEFSTGANK